MHGHIPMSGHARKVGQSHIHITVYKVFLAEKSPDAR
jgi:hypothetical protein